ncbi:MAG: tyrosine-protein phosphatase, partial [Anaerolineae bacterium]|nr:tyrosine-protein phosphatase [Anaerolineae bacterium]
YSLSNFYYEAFRQIVQKAVRQLVWLGITVDDMQLMLTANPEMMQAVLDHIRRRYGSVEGYLRDAAGLDDDTISRLRAQLLE